MLIQSKYTKIFHSKDLTRQKYDELYDFAVLIQNHKNTVSQYVNDNLLHFLEYNKFQFLKEMRKHFKDAIQSSFDAQLYAQVFTCYQNKFDAIQRKLVYMILQFQRFKQVIPRRCVPFVDVLKMKTDRTKRHLNVLNVDIKIMQISMLQRI